MSTTVVRASYVIGFDGADHVVHRDGCVVYSGDSIVHVGPSYEGPADEVIDAGEAIVGPGFIDLDALSDIDHALIDTWHASSDGLTWSAEYAAGRRAAVFPLEETLFMREYALTQLIRNGITTAMPIAAETHSAWAESYEEFAGIAEIAGRLGLRMYLGPSYRSGVPVMRDGARDVHWEPELGEKGLAEAVRFVRDFDGAYDGRLRGALLPCRIETVTLDLMRATARAAEELDCLVRLHCMQGLTELRLLREWYGRHPLDVLESVGLLGPRLLIPHALYLGTPDAPFEGSPDRLAALAGIVHCPLTTVRYGDALQDFDRYRAAGVNVALGTDSFPPDMIRNMDYGNNLAKLVTGRLEAGSAADYYRAATLSGARALGRDDLGRLAPKAKADLVVVDLSGPRTGPVDDPIRTLLMNCSGADVTTVVIDGRVVMRDRVIPGVDEAAFRRRAQAYFTEMKAAYSTRDHLRRPVEELFPPSFRPA
ncbi:amidohydrolase family protein [Nonomuraea africana]|uniref:Cytosine/adenosine deaminase-related metal-dependent hydrolase n=1 Tax=Nonomuraea africana TaxID=46171 RepID=A0ABR9K7Z1_9ACTN|nr:amidohydrolase family protein [Nonomuraea africana]MBE1558129.1 cytosine/adenosine deaminase-related metal-dependent hydrolase [Nonomuraea africana]